MNIRSLFLASAALVSAGGAFAADLPAKQAAPAADAVRACPAYGSGFFTLPGSETCLKFGGYMRYIGQYNDPNKSATTAQYAQSARFRLEVDARSNTEFGVLRGFSRMNDATLSRAFIQIGAFTAGRYGNSSDISGTYGENYSSLLSTSTESIGVKYEAKLGPVSAFVAIENAFDNNGKETTGDKNPYVADRPDAIIGLSTKIDIVDFKLNAISHQIQTATDTGEGYAVIGSARAKIDAVGFALYGGISKGALLYTWGGTSSNAPPFTDSASNGKGLSDGTNVGAELTYTMGPGTLALAAGRITAEQSTGAKTTLNRYGVAYGYNVTKDLIIMPELMITETDKKGSPSTYANIAYVTITRSF
jgi:hypothetical protein